MVMGKQIKYSEPENYFPKSAQKLFDEAEKKRAGAKKPATASKPKKKSK